MGTKHFGGVTHWDVWNPRGGIEGWSQPGWALPSDPTRYISPNDPYWGRVLQQARQAYGDPNIHFSTDSVADNRHLVFGDDARLPADGTIVYHDAAAKRDWAQNDDGTVSLVGPDGHPGPPMAPVGYRKVGERYAPINGQGDQVGPQLGGVPSNDNGFHIDPVTGTLTPKNANGDYYTLGPDGKKSFFDKNGAPITEQQFDNPSKPPGSGGQQPPGGALPTDEQQSGKAAEAVKKLQQELKNHYSKICDAEEKLSEILLGAHATTAAGQKQLNDIQDKIVEAVNNPTMEMDTAAGERAFLTFLRNQVSDINKLLASGSLSAEDQSKAAQALSALYAADAGGAGTHDDAAAPPATAPPAQQPAAPALAPGPEAAVTDPGPGPAPQVPDPGLSDVLGGTPMGMPMGADPLSSLGSLLPAALGGLGAGGASPLDGLGGLLGGESSLADLASGHGDHGSHDHPSDTTDDSTEPAKDGKNGRADPAKADSATAQAGGPQQAGGGPSGQNATTAAGGPPAPAVPPAAPSATVKLPDGSTATARTPQAAQAIRDYLAGDTVDASYGKNGIQLPPPGTPITHPVDPSRLTCGDLAMFKDHYVPVLSAVKAYLSGQVVPLGSVSSSPDFLGWIDPTAAAPTAAAPAAAVPAPPAAPAAAPPPPADLPAPVPGG